MYFRRSWYGVQSGKTALQLAEAFGHTAAADAIRSAALLHSQKELRESASSGNLAAVKDVLGMAGLNVDAANEVCLIILF